MKKTPFKLRSGNITPFKEIGSSPIKQGEGKTIGGMKKFMMENDIQLRSKSGKVLDISKYSNADLERIASESNKRSWQKFKRGSGRLLGGVGVGLMLHDMYKSGQEHSDGKVYKDQETGIVTPDPEKSIYNKPKKSIYDKK